MFCGTQVMFAERNEEEELTFDGVVNEVSGRTSYYDFIVERFPREGGSMWVADLRSCQSVCEAFTLQQERNEARIELKRQQREAKSKNL